MSVSATRQCADRGGLAKRRLARARIHREQDVAHCPNLLQVQGMTQKDADGRHVPYTGMNGRYRRTDKMLNFR